MNSSFYDIIKNVTSMFTMKQENGFEGYIDRVENGWLFGWAWNKNLPNSPIKVDIYLNGKRALTAEASLYRPDLESLGKGNGRHGFEIAIPKTLMVGPVNQISACFSGTNETLHGGSFVLEQRTEGSGTQPSGATFRSRFGGLWTDLSNARDVIEGKVSLGWISTEEGELLKKWLDDGFVILPQAVPHDLIDDLDADVEKIWRGTSPYRCFVEFSSMEGGVIHPAGPEFKDKRAKVLDAYLHLESARRVIFSPGILRFISLLFERPILAFQSLYFRWGSRQAIHQDTAFVKVSSPLEFVASWIALEDIRPGSGELEYYKGSHNLDEYLFEGRHKWMPTKSPEHDRYHESLHEKSRALGLERLAFAPKKGDVLVWSADLAHGGSHRVTEGITRKSIVTHYCPQTCEPAYSGTGKSPRFRYNALASYTFKKRD
jgi:phytanoyl-CoA hydroxylase